MSTERTFAETFAALFECHHPVLLRYLDRLTGDAELATDIAQEAFVKLFERGSLPDNLKPWLVTVANNLFRDHRRRTTRRSRLLEFKAAGEPAFLDAESVTAALDEEHTRRRVRLALDTMDERDRQLLLLRDEGYSYRDLASALELGESSIGTLLARAKASFRRAYEGGNRALG